MEDDSRKDGARVRKLNSNRKKAKEAGLNEPVTTVDNWGSVSQGIPGPL